MSTYIYFTNAQKEQARRTDLAELLRSQGETLKRSGSEFEWLDGSQKVTICGNLWYHQYEQVGGDAIDFVRRFMDKNYPEAVEYLLGRSGGALTVSPLIVKESKPFELPPKNETMRRVYAYLVKHRGIDSDVLNSFMKAGMIYESADYHNAVFVGFDKDGIPRHANLRGTGSNSTFKGNVPSSQPEYSFHWSGADDKLFLFEAPIDLLSFISMYKDDWKNHNYAASCGVSDRVLFQCLKENPNIGYVYICFDSDEPGQTAAGRISSKLITMGIRSQILVPTYKDWNEDRRAAEGNCPHFRADFSFPNEDEKEGEEECQALAL